MDAVKTLKTETERKMYTIVKKTIKMRGLEKTDRYRIELKE